MADDLRIHIDGEAHSFDDFELGDLEWLEDFIGQPATNMQALSTVKALVAMVFLIKRRTNPEYTIEEARKIKMASIGEPDEPEQPEAKRPPKRAAR